MMRNLDRGKKIHTMRIIAEAGVNHECNIDLAKKLIEDAANSGANAIKFQTYKADTIASKIHHHIGIHQKKN